MNKYKILIALLMFSSYSSSMEADFRIKQTNDINHKLRSIESLELKITYHNNYFKADTDNNLIEAISINRDDSLIFKNPKEEALFQKIIVSVPKNHFFIIYKNDQNEVTSLKVLGDIFRYDLSHTRESDEGPAHRHSNSSIINLVLPTDNQIKSFDIYQSDKKIRRMSSHTIN